MLRYKALIYLKFISYNLGSIIIVPILFFMLFYNTNFVGDHSNNNSNLNFLQNSYAIEENNEDEYNEKDEDASNNNTGKSIFNFVAVGDWDCTGDTEDTVDNILNKTQNLF